MVTNKIIYCRFRIIEKFFAPHQKHNKSVQLRTSLRLHLSLNFSPRTAYKPQLSTYLSNILRKLKSFALRWSLGNNFIAD